MLSFVAVLRSIYCIDGSCSHLRFWTAFQSTETRSASHLFYASTALQQLLEMIYQRHVLDIIDDCTLHIWTVKNDIVCTQRQSVAVKIQISV